MGKVRLGSAAFVLALAMLATAAAASGQSGGRHVLAGTRPVWATAANQQGSVAGGASIDFTVYLRMRDNAGAHALAQAVSTPGSSEYGHYLSAGEFNARFAPSAAQAASVTAWLRSQGLRVTGTASNRTWISGSGQAAAVERAFGTQLATFTVRGHARRAVTTPVSVPAALADTVAAVGGLSQTTQMKPLASPAADPSPGFRNARPCSAYWAQKMAITLPEAFGAVQPYAPCGYTPNQLRGAYGLGTVRSGWDGAGVTVAYTDAYDSPTLLADANEYSSRHAIQPFAAGQFVDASPAGLSGKPNQNACGDWYGEQTLDLEAIHAMAPAARVVYVGGKSCFDNPLLNALHTIVDNNMAQAISNSWGGIGETTDPTVISAYNHLFTQAALKGIGIYYSSGDNGDEVDTTGSRQADFPADDPFVTAVGGTSLAVGQGNQRLFETGWGTGKSTLTNGKWKPKPPGAWLYGGGGGTSTVFPEPWYQQGVVPKSLSMYYGAEGIKKGGRVVPDVAMVGDPTTGMLVGQTQQFQEGVAYGEYRIGGTSLSSPQFVGLMAVADAQAGHPHGFVNPALYAIANGVGYNDIVDPATTLGAMRVDFVNGENNADGLVYSLRSLNQTQSLHTVPGYDDVTGNGTPTRSFIPLLNRVH
jgi:subtilase family serine protease